MIATFGSPVSERNGFSQFRENGFITVPDVVSARTCVALATQLTKLLHRQQGASSRIKGGLRNVLRSSSLAGRVARAEGLISLVSGLAGREVFPVRGILFDKSPDANWNVPWHQDLAIAVARRIETPCFGPWSVKAGVAHVQPPPQILADMITVRLHLDDCSADNGALRVIPGSHRYGELGTNEINALVDREEAVVCEVPRGGVLLMRPLLLHASSAAKVPSHRRVLHLEYAAAELPNGLKWFEQS